MTSYRIFLAHNFLEHSQWIIDDIRSIASNYCIELLLSTAGSSAISPAEDVLRNLEVADGLLGIVENDNSWINNEVGIAFALRLPIYIIAHMGKAVDGVKSYVTSVSTVDLHDRHQLKLAVEKGLSHLLIEVDRIRDRLPEPPLADQMVVQFSWRRYYSLIEKAYKSVRKNFRPTILLGISRGGIIVADILARLSINLPLGLIHAIREKDSVIVELEPLHSVIRHHCETQWRFNREVRILVIGDVIRSGISLNATMERIRGICNSVESNESRGFHIASLVLVSQGDPQTKSMVPDYCIESVPDNCSIILPYGRG